MDGHFDVTRAAEEHLGRLKARLDQAAPGLALDPACPREGRSSRYTWVPENIEGANRMLRAKHAGLAADFNRYVLLHALTHFSLGDSAHSIPSSIASLYTREFERILRQIETFDDAFFDLANDEYLKDLAILTHRLIPVGAEFAEGGAGIPRRLAFAGGLKQFGVFLWLVIFRCRGVEPFFALHAHTLSLEDFNYEGWQATYHRLAELLTMNPKMKGWLSASWFLDPALESISPHLVHLRKVPVDNGATLLFVGREDGDTSGALTKSRTRRRLHAEGKYRPTTYMRVWPRSALLAWDRGRGGSV